MTERTANNEKLPPIHPGEILEEEFLRPMNITQYRLAKSIRVDARRVHAIVNGERSISAETALLFSRFFGNSAEFWMGLQSQYDLEVAEDRLGERLSGVLGYDFEEYSLLRRLAKAQVSTMPELLLETQQDDREFELLSPLEL